MSKFQAIRGMNDILPTQTIYWQYLENELRRLTHAYGYQEIRFPAIEQTALFKRSIGEATDIVEKEMFTFNDRDGTSLTLRPEGTAGCVRACIEHNLAYKQTQKLWYMGPMFRYERPQKGRYRQFYQFGVEAIGFETPDVDAELLCMSARLWERLGIHEHVALQLNSLGSRESRARYRELLVEYFSAHRHKLDEDSQRRLTTNPLRILDSKNPDMQELIGNAPIITDHLDATSEAHFNRLKHLLDALHIRYEINPRLVRGLDYYCDTVFEWVTDLLGSQNAICSGGRYDHLFELLGDKPMPAVGFAMGQERIVSLLEMKKQFEQSVDVYFILSGDAAEERGLQTAEKLRSLLPELQLMVNYGGGSFKSQFKRADKSGAHLALILADNEVQNQTVSIKFLREDKPQESIALSNLGEYLCRYFSFSTSRGMHHERV